MDEKTKPKEIIIDIENIDTKAIKEQERLLQNDAYEKLSFLLDDKYNKINQDKDILENRRHNTIFIDGERGSGKTQFLLSIRNYLKEIDNKNKTDLSKDFYFFSPIDPTLLHDNESFLTIIIAKILNNLEKYGKLKDLTKKEKKIFYLNLNNVAEAIDGIVENKNKTSLEIISQDQTSLKLEQYTHKLFKNITDIVNRDRLVLLIDDIDMAFDKGFEVLEVIRKYLSSPYIIPIVTGDRKLYEYIITHNFVSKNKMDKFMKDEDNYKGIFKNEGYRELINGISTDYLIKVFPTNRRLKLKSLYDLYYNDNKKVKKEIVFKRNNNNITNMSELFTKLNNSNLFQIKRGKALDKFIKNLLTNGLRRLIQFFNANKNNELFNLMDSENLHNLEKEYFLTLSINIDGYKTFIDGGKEHLSNGRIEDAIEYFNTAFKYTNLDKQKAEIYYHLGITYSMDKNDISTDKAIKAFKKSIMLNNKDNNSYVYLSFKYIFKERFNEAKELLIQMSNSSLNKEIITIGSIYNNLGYVYIQLKEYTLAEESLNLSLKQEEEDSFITYVNLMTIYLIKGLDNSIEDEFTVRFQDNKEAMKFYSLFRILFKIKQNIEIYNYKEDLTEWIDQYSTIRTSTILRLVNLKQWANQELSRDKLLDCLNTFEQYI